MKGKVIATRGTTVRSFDGEKTREIGSAIVLLLGAFGAVAQ
jgi:hypothetical protein